MYGISEWYGFLNKSHILQINRLFERAFKYRYVKSVYNLEQCLHDYDDNLFTKATHGNYAMHHLLPSPTDVYWTLAALVKRLDYTSIHHAYIKT